MEIITAENLSFTYASESKKVLDGINFKVNSGEFVLICGRSGCGKTTLLRCLKPNIAPKGQREGRVLFCGEEHPDEKALVSDIGFVFQNPEEQIVCDSVFSEMAFGLENLGADPQLIRQRIAEISAFFGMENRFSSKTAELSGGQKQLLNLASVMALQPKILLLDEPLSQLDPISAGKFINMLERINKELGLTIVISEHSLDELLPCADRVCVLENGKMIFDGEPKDAARFLISADNPMKYALPSATIIGSKIDIKSFPITVKECRDILYFSNKKGNFTGSKNSTSKQEILNVKGLCFTYERGKKSVIDNLSLTCCSGEILSIFGENGSGKSTLLKLLAGCMRAQSGKIKTKAKRTAYLPQETSYAFLEDVFEDDLILLKNNVQTFDVPRYDFFNDIDLLMHKHYLDMSGGERQRAALYKLLLTAPNLLLLDEPTKGLDAYSKAELAKLLENLKNDGMCIIIVTHDTEFSALVSDRCAMMFMGDIAAIDNTRNFFCNNNFFTTHARRISRGIFENAITCEEVIECANEK